MPTPYFRYKVIAFLLLFFPFFHIGLAQNTHDSIGFLEFPIEQISIDQGLSQGMINGIAEDQNGYLWIATKDGLNRFDGTSFKVFRHNPEDSSSIAENFINSICVDAQNRIWIGTRSRGLNLFLPETESFQHFDKNQSSANSITSNLLGRIYDLGKGKILLETLDEARFNVLEITDISGKEKVLSQFNPIEKALPTLFEIVKNAEWTNNIRVDAFLNIWFYDGVTLYKLNPGKAGLYDEIETFRFPVTTPLFLKTDRTLLLSHSREELFIFLEAGKLLKYDQGSKSFKEVASFPFAFNEGGKCSIDSKQRFWGWFDDGTGVRYDLTTNELTEISPMWNQAEPFAKNHHGIGVEDARGNFWCGTGGNGLIKISSRIDLFKRLPNFEDFFTGSNEGHFRVERAGTKSLYSSYILSLWRNLKISRLNESKQLTYSRFHGHLTFDNNEKFWTERASDETNYRYLLKVDPHLLTVDTVFAISNDDCSNFGLPIIIDEQNDIWLGGNNKSGEEFLFKYSQQNEVMQKFTFPSELDKVNYRFISDWLETDDNNWWFATTQGLYFFNPSTEKWKVYKNNPDDVHSLAINMTLCVCPDPVNPQKYIWVGTEGGGMNKLNVETGEFERFTTKNGLPNDVVYAIQADDNHNLWLSTNNGLCQFYTENNEIKVFTKADGIPSNEFNRYEFSKAMDGEMFFGTTNGVLYFNPEDFYKSYTESPVVINKLWLFNQEVNFTNPDKNIEYLLPAPIDQCTHLTFEPDQDMITFGFAVMDLTAPSKNRFKFRLKGLNDNWIETGARSEATFTDLNPGQYTLEVLGCNSAGVWNESPLKLNIEILSPWYGTFWFRTMIVLLIITLLFLIYRYRLREALKVERMRNQIAQDLHDEIGSTLSSISLYSAVMQRSSDTFSTKVNDILIKVIDSTSEIMESMNDIVWTIKSENDSFEHVVNRMRAFAVKMCEAKDVNLHFHSDPQSEKIIAGMDLRKNIYLIFKEAVNNAVKYSEAESLQIEITKENNLLILSISDNGIGIDMTALPEKKSMLGGNGIAGMHFRAKAINAAIQFDTAKNEGCRITISVAV